MLKQITLMAAVITLIAMPALADNSKEDVIIGENTVVKITDGITVVTLPGQNTNGEDLKCVVYEAFGNNGGAGGIDCNWTPANLQRRK